MYTKPAFISVFSGFLSSQNRQKWMNSRIKVVFETTDFFSLSRDFWANYEMIGRPLRNNKKQGQENEHMETEMSKTQNLFVTERVSSLSMKIWIIKEASFAEAQSIK